MSFQFSPFSVHRNRSHAPSIFDKKQGILGYYNSTSSKAAFGLGIFKWLNSKGFLSSQSPILRKSNGMPEIRGFVMRTLDQNI
jgi:hypothetical protein